MKKLLLFIAIALVGVATATAQDPFGDKTKKVYIFNAGLVQIMSDYAAMTPKTYSLKKYSPTGLELKVFEVTEIDPSAHTYVLYTPGTSAYMKVPTGPGIVSTTDVTADRTPIVINQNEDGTYQLRTQAGLRIAPYANGAFYMLGALNEVQFSGFCKAEWDAWDFVAPEDLLDYLKAHEIDPDFDPYAPVVKYNYDDLADLMLQAEDIFNCVEGYVEAEGEPLITAPEQFSSAYSDEEEGTDFFSLIDEEPTTFWHSNWHEEAEVPAGNHSFEVALTTQPTDGLYYAEYTGRMNGQNCSPVKMHIYGAQRQGDQLEWESQPFAQLTREDGLGAYAGWGTSSYPEYLSGHFSFQTTKSYDALRFEVTEVVADEADITCFNYSEFQLYQGKRTAPVLYAPAEQIEALRHLYNEARYLSETDDPTDTYNALLEAIEAIDLRTIPEGVAGVNTNTKTNTLAYDLQGRSIICQPKLHGIYILDGKKLIK